MNTESLPHIAEDQKIWCVCPCSGVGLNEFDAEHHVPREYGFQILEDILNTRQLPDVIIAGEELIEILWKRF